MSGESRLGSRSVADVVDSGGKGRSRFRLIALTVVVLAIAVSGFSVYSGGDRSGAPDYVTQTIARGELAVTVSATGTLQPTEQIAVGSEVSGLIKAIFVDFNDTVTEGQILAQMDTEQLEAREDSARASLDVAEASLVQARATAEEATARAARSETLFAQGALAQDELDTNVAAARRAVASVDSAAAQVNSARGTLQEAETALRKAVIRSPIDGIVLSRVADPGQSIAASFEVPVLFQLSKSLETMLLHLDVDESDIGQVREGQTARFRVDAFPRRTFDARIVSVRFDPRTVNNVVAYEAVLSVENPELLLRPGMTATAEILVAERADTMLVPNRALRFVPPDYSESTARSNPDQGRVFVLDGGAAMPVSIVIGESNGEFTEVLGGPVDVGTEVIVDVARNARDERSGGLFQ